MYRSLRFLLSLSSAAIVAATTAHAQPADHLQCYKIKDPNAFRGVVALNSPQFGPTGACKIKIRGTKFCVPTRKQVVDIDPEVQREEFESESLAFDRICYRVKCPDATLPSPQVTDQFGTRVIETRGITEICTPAVKGPAPNPVCGNAILEPGEECENATDCSGGAGCSPTCTCQCLAADTQCPNVLELTSLAGTGSEVTSTEEDWGSAGIAHDMDVVDRSRLELNIVCAGSGPSSCDECDVRGVNPAIGNCRCENDHRAVCDQPFVNDGDDCGGDACVCYAAPPTPRSQGSTPFCLLPRLTEEPDGSWNVDTGIGSVELQLVREVYLGDSLVEPCPTCDGDVTPDDGVRDGTCTRGDNDGQSCDANGTDATFPAPGGGSYSYDCFPDSGQNISGPGAQVSALTLSTSASSLTAAVPCGFPPSASATCHCGVCSGDSSIPCSADTQCLAAGAGSCVQQGTLQFPNACDDLTCSPAGGGEGVCAGGPTDSLCDGMLRANGEGIVQCLSNADCEPQNIGFDAGDCTLTKQRECFLSTIDAQGSPSTSQPAVAGIACTARTANTAINSIVGLPGPLRIKLEAETAFRCASDPSFTYPNCP